MSPQVYLLYHLFHKNTNLIVCIFGEIYGFSLFYTHFLKVCRCLFERMELNGMNSCLSGSLTVFCPVIQKYRFLRIQMISADQSLIDIRLRLDLLHFAGKNSSVHIFQKCQLVTGFPQGICGIIG